MKKVVSYSWFRSPTSAYEQPSCGDWQGRFFSRHLPAIVRAHHACFPDYELRIHHDGQAFHGYYGATLHSLQQGGLLTLVYCGPSQRLCESMLWRMLPTWDPTVDVLVCRDLDSLPSPRERVMVERWIASGLAVHGIHDSTSHNGTPLMGGMISLRPQRFRELTGISGFADLMQRAKSRRINLNDHGTDQVLLNLEAWPRVRQEAMLHKLKGGTDEGAMAAVYDAIGPLPNDLAWMDEGTRTQADALSPHVGAMFAHYQPVEFYDTHHAPAGHNHVGFIREMESRSGDVVGVPHPVDPERRVLFSCDLNRDYAFFLPLSTWMWRLAGYRPAIMLIGEVEEWTSQPTQLDGPTSIVHGALRIGARSPENQQCMLAALRARQLGAELYFVKAPEGHRASTAAQVARLYGGMLPLRDDRYILTADADMWPLSTEFFRLDHSSRFHVLYANAYMKEVAGPRGRPELVPEGKYPICYLGGSVQTWREIMQLPKASGTLEGELQHQLDGGLGRGSGGDVAWNYDELLFGVRFQEWLASGLAPNPPAHMRNRRGAPPVDRIDRSCWPPAGEIPDRLQGASDTHLPRPGWHDDHWPKLRAILERRAPDIVAWADQYRNEFLGLAP